MGEKARYLLVNILMFPIDMVDVFGNMGSSGVEVPARQDTHKKIMDYFTDAEKRLKDLKANGRRFENE